MTHQAIEVSEAAAGVRTITLNRPDKRNAINNTMRRELLEALETADQDESVRVTIVCGAGTCFSSGYDLKSDLNADQPYYTANVGMQWAKHVSEGWMSIWDLAKPVIAMIHGYAMAGGLELVGACDLAYASSDSKLSHPVLQFAGLPDFPWFPAMLQARHAMELHLTGRVYSGEEAASVGLINQAFASDELEACVLEIAQRIAATPPAVVTVNKRFVHAAQELRGARSIIRVGGDLQAGPHMQALMQGGTSALGDDIKAASKKTK